MFIQKYLNIIRDYINKIYQNIKNFKFGKSKNISSVNHNNDKKSLPDVKYENDISVVKCKIKKVTIKEKKN